eukprot:SAG31_NODE_44_length_31168_cov_16.507290_4_plen_1779_part_00
MAEAGITGPYRAMQILIKHDKSARLASWRDPDGAQIKQRTKADALSKLSTVRAELESLSGEEVAARFAEFARAESDCASAKEGGDLGQLEEEEMMEEFEEAVGCLGEFELSKVFESESGVHLALRTPLGYTPPPAGAVPTASPQGTPVVITGPYRAMQILIKHDKSARLASWRDPDGAQIKQRTKADALSKLSTVRAELESLSGEEVAARFAEFARAESDCASAKEGGDLGQLEEEEMMEEFEEAVGCLGEFELSKVFESESGVHLALRTPLGYTPPPAGATPLSVDQAATIVPVQTAVAAGADAYRGSHILIKHCHSARLASWKDPDGAEIHSRSKDAAISQLVHYMAELSELKGEALVDRVDEIAFSVSDCGHENVGGIGDTGICHPGDMDEVFEAALLRLEIGDMSAVVITDSGCHLIVRTRVDRPPPKWPPQRNMKLPIGTDAPKLPSQEPAISAPSGQFRALHILIKHQQSARLASWRDPEGEIIKARTKQEAEDMLAAIRFKVNEGNPEQRIKTFMELAQTESDSGNSQVGGIADTGAFALGDTDPAIEEAVQCLALGDISDYVLSESGSHILLRIDPDEILPVQHPSGTNSLITGPYRAMQILIKHDKSARLASCRDPDGAQIKQRTKADALSKLSTVRAELESLSGEEVAARFAEFARAESDCASAKEGGDLGQLEEEEMMEEFEEAVGCLGEFELSKVFESESGVHLALRTPLGYTPPPAGATPLSRGDVGVTTARAEDMQSGSVDVRDYYALHILVKHQGSSRQQSWRDPHGKTIQLRARSAAVKTLSSFLQEMHSLKDAELKKRFMYLAKEHSDCGTAGKGGDLERIEVDSMERSFEEAALAIDVGTLSGIVDTDSGSHIILRSDPSWFPHVTVNEAAPGMSTPATKGTPQAAATASSSGRLSMKGRFKAKAKMVMALRRFTTGTKVSYFETALHKLLGKRSTERVNSLTLEKVQEVFELDPESIEIQDPQGRFPHQVALENDASASIIEWLVSKCPLAEVFYKIIRACAQQEWLDVMHLVDAAPAVAHISDAKLRLPIHLALLSGAPLRVLEHLATAHPPTKEIVVREHSRRTAVSVRAHMTMGAIEQSIERISTGHDLHRSSKFFDTDRKALITLLELGRLAPREMNQVLELDLSDVDDHIFFWKGENVQAALKADMSGCSFAEEERDGYLPLQWAIKCRADFDAVELVKDAYPDAVKAIDIEGKTTLHLAAEVGLSLRSIKMLHAANATMCETQDLNGRFPLVLAMNRVHAEEQQAKEGRSSSQRLLPSLRETVEFLRGLNPSAIAYYDLSKAVGGPSAFLSGGGAKAFHDPEWSVAKDTVDRCPLAASFADCSGRMPLHHAVEKGAPLAVVKAIFSAYEDGATVADEEQRHPLHLVSKATPASVIEFLVKMAKSSCTAMDKNQRVPLMMAVANGAPFKGVLAIHKAAPKLLKGSPDAGPTLDCNRKNILHFISADTPFKVVELLLKEAPPELSEQRDGFSKFPVQSAIGLGVSGKVLEKLTAAYPTGRNAYELWRACNLGKWTRSLEIVAADPAAAGLPSEQDGGFPLQTHNRPEPAWQHYPLHLCLRWELKSHRIAPGNVVQAIVDAFPEAIFVTDREGNLPMDIVLEKEKKHGARALGTIEVKHALTNLAVSSVIDLDLEHGLDEKELKSLPVERIVEVLKRVGVPKEEMSGKDKPELMKLLRVLRVKIDQDIMRTEGTRERLRDRSLFLFSSSESKLSELRQEHIFSDRVTDEDVRWYLQDAVGEHPKTGTAWDSLKDHM